MNRTRPPINRGDIWLADFDPTTGREQAGIRPCLIISVNGFNQGGAELVIALPITSRKKAIRSHIAIQPPEGGLTLQSFVKTEDIRSISEERLIRRLGSVTDRTLSQVGESLSILLGL